MSIKTIILMITLSVIGVTSFSGCIRSDTGSIDKVLTNGSDIKVEVENVILDKLWELQSFGPIGAEEKVLPDKKVTLQFGPDNRITGSGGCNQYFASYKIGTGNTLSVGLMGSTKMYCEGFMEQEQQYFTALGNASTFEVEQNRLQLFYNDGQGVLNFAISKGLYSQ